MRGRAGASACARLHLGVRLRVSVYARAHALNVNDASGLYLALVLQSSNRVSSAHGFGFCVSVMEYQPWIFCPVEAFFVVSLGGQDITFHY